MGDFNYNSTSLLLHGDGADLSTTITDNSYTTKTVTAVSGAKISTDAWTGRIGTASIKLNGTSDYCTIPYHADFDFPGDFSIEATVYLTAYGPSPYAATIAARYLASGTNTGWQLRINGTASAWTTINLYTGLTDLNVTGLSLALNTKYVIGVFRTGSAINVTLDGVVVGTLSNSDSFTRSSASPLYIGKLNDAANLYFPGYIDELRITKGVGRQTGAYTPSLVAFPDVVETALMQMDLAAPTQTLALFSGAQIDLTAPMGSMEMFTGLVSDLTAPSPSVDVVFGSVIELTSPMGTVSATMHDATGENAIDLAAPMATLEVAFGDHFELTAPRPTLEMALTGTSLFSADLTAPMGALEMAGTTTAVMSADLTGPMGTVQIYSGAVISVTGPMGTVEVVATAGGVGSIEVTCPLFQLECEITANAHMSFDLIAPMPQMGQGSMQAWMIAPMGQLELVGTAVVTATYEAYALNLNHKGFKDPVDELTRYTNFPFTHIVRYRNSYFGVAGDGLYLLDGTTDFDSAAPTVPTAIPWAWKTGMDDFGKAEKKTVVSAYFAGRLGTNATVTLYPGEDTAQPYAYSVPRTTNAQNYRQKFGLGIKSRYFALGASGDDELALDEIELNVAQLTRRI